MDENIEIAGIHKMLFGDLELTQELVEKYSNAVQSLIYTEYDRKTPSVRVDISHVSWLHLESIEYYLRFKHPSNTLSQKVKILIFLCESRSRYYNYFINEKCTYNFLVILKLMFMTIRSIFLLARGSYLSRKFKCLT